MVNKKLTDYINQTLTGIIEGTNLDGYIIKSYTNEDRKNVISVHLNLDIDKINEEVPSNNSISFDLEIIKK
jgi:hypothetical protein